MNSTSHMVNIGVTAGLLVLIPMLAGAQIPGGSAFVVNQETAGDQKNPNVSARANGEIVVVWDTPNALNCRAVVGRRMTLSGGFLGGDFLIAESQAGCDGGPHMQMPLVDLDPDSGRFVVEWDEDPGIWPVQMFRVLVRRFDFGAGALSDPMTVSEQEGYFPGAAGVHHNANGDGFAALWEGFGIPEPWLLGSTYSNDGVVIAADYSLVSERSCESSWGTTGLLTAYSSGFDFPESLDLQRFSETGSPLGDPVHVFSGLCDRVRLAQNDNGRSLVVWTDVEWAGNGVYARLFGPDDSPLTAVIELGSVYSSSEVSVSSDGAGFLVSWIPDHDAPPQIVGRAVTADGLVPWSEFVIRGPSLYAKGDPSVHGIDQGRYLVVWHEDVLADPSNFDVLAALVDSNTIFRDGFESGDLSAWMTP